MLTKRLTVGIDATNLRRGGGVTHLVELLRAARPENQGIERVVIWGGGHMLNAVDDRPWLDKQRPIALEKGLLLRSLWQRYRLSQVARDAECDVLFVPGGNFVGDFHPVVTMSRNMLPFELHELKRYGWSIFTLKLLLLRLTQSRSYKKAEGLIFLTNYACQGVLKVTGKLPGEICTIPHGLNPRFIQAPKSQRPIEDFDFAKPYRVLYVSIIDQYKHQWVVVEAIAALRQLGIPVVLDLVGPAFPSALKRLKDAVNRLDPNNDWAFYHGAFPFDELNYQYSKADLGLFASSCENMPNILLETMASGLPIACSNRGPMPEVLGAGGLYFDPEQAEQVARTLRQLIESPQLRADLSQVSYRQAQQYSWRRCADQTFEFLVSIAQKHTGRNYV